MNRRLNAFALGALLVLCAAGLSAQNVFVLPPSFGVSSDVTAFTANPFAQAGIFSANSAATQVLTADGLKYYIVSANGTNTVMAVDSTFTNVRVVASLGSAATASAISPDGKRLVVATATVQIFDTATDAQLAAGINVFGTTVDMTANLESTRMFVLANTGNGTQLTAIDLASNSFIGNVAIPGFATGISTGPNDLLYVTTLNAVLEIDPRNLTTRQQIPIVGRPGKMVFTPDGKLGIMPNQTPVTGTVLVTFDLNARTVGAGIATASLPANTVLDKLFVVATNRLLALSSNTQTAFDITLNPLAVNAFAFSSVGSITAAAITSDIATPLHAITQYLFFLAGGNLNRVDLSAAQLSGQLPVSNGGGSISVATAPVTATPATILTFGDNQSVTLGGTTLPLVVRLLDAQGRPLARTQVTFSTTALGVTLSATNVTTSNDGFAVTTAVVPNSIGPFNVLASAAGGLNASFTVNVGVVGGGVTGGLTITGGQGQLLLESAVSAPLSVVLKNTNGNPIVGGNVTFTLAQGTGTLLGGVSALTNVTVVQTDGTGTASINFLSTQLFSNFPGFESEVITASTDAGASVTFFITTAKAVANPTSGIGGPSVLILKPALGDLLSGQAGQTLKGAVQVQVSAISGQPIPNVSLFIDPQDQTLPHPAMCAGTFALSGANGVASCDLVLGGQVGTVQILPDAGYFATGFPITVRITSGPPGAVNIVQGNNQSGKPGDRLPVALVVQVTDAFGNVLPGVQVAFNVVTPGSLTLVNVIGTTDAVGRAGASVILGNIAGTFQVTATVGNITKTFNETVVIPAAALQLVSGNGQTAVVNTGFAAPLVVRVVDAQGNGFAGAQVVFAVTGGFASFVGTSSPTTDAQGNASVIVQAGSNQGSITITASFGGFSVTFTLTARLPGPANIVFLNGASFVQNVVSPGAIVTIQGNGVLTGVQGLFTAFNILGPLPTSFPIPANLGTGSILFNNVAAGVFYVANINGVETITVQVPFETPTGTVTVTINAVNGTTATITIQVQPLGPGVFETLDGNQKIAIVQRPDGSYVNSRNPAHRNERLRIFVTGLGQVSPAAASGNPGVPNQAVIASLIVGLNNAGVPLISAEYAPGLVGVYVITIEVPSDAALGPAQPFGLIATDSAGNQYFAQGTSLPIQ